MSLKYDLDMDEDIDIIDTNTRNEKIKNFFLTNKNKLVIFLILILLILVIFFGYGEFKKNQKIKISNLYNSTILEFNENTKIKSLDSLIQIVNEKDPTYSLLSLYFILDNNLVNDRNKINDLFDVLIKKVSLDKEIKNLVIYKKGLFNADESNENELLNILDPLIKSDSVLEITRTLFNSRIFLFQKWKIKI